MQCPSGDDTTDQTPRKATHLPPVLPSRTRSTNISQGALQMIIHWELMGSDWTVLLYLSCWSRINCYILFPNVSKKEKAKSFHKRHRDQTYLGQAISQEMEEKTFPRKGREEESLPVNSAYSLERWINSRYVYLSFFFLFFWILFYLFFYTAGSY